MFLSWDEQGYFGACQYYIYLDHTKTVALCVLPVLLYFCVYICHRPTCLQLARLYSSIPMLLPCYLQFENKYAFCVIARGCLSAKHLGYTFTHMLHIWGEILHQNFAAGLLWVLAGFPDMPHFNYWDHLWFSTEKFVYIWRSNLRFYSRLSWV